MKIVLTEEQEFKGRVQAYKYNLLFRIFGPINPIWVACGETREEAIDNARQKLKSAKKILEYVEI